jgi:hypothetical protein
LVVTVGVLVIWGRSRNGDRLVLVLAVVTPSMTMSVRMSLSFRDARGALANVQRTLDYEYSLYSLILVNITTLLHVDRSSNADGSHEGGDKYNRVTHFCEVCGLSAQRHCLGVFVIERRKGS